MRAGVAEELVGGEVVFGEAAFEVMSFELIGAVTAAHVAGRVAFFDRDLERFGDVAGSRHDGLDVDAVGDHELEQPVGEDLAGVGDGDGPDAGDLADLLAGGGLVVEQPPEADAEAGDRDGVGGRGVAADVHRAAAELDEGVVAVGVGRVVRGRPCGRR